MGNIKSLPDDVKDEYLKEKNNIIQKINDLNSKYRSKCYDIHEEFGTLSTKFDILSQQSDLIESNITSLGHSQIDLQGANTLKDAQLSKLTDQLNALNDTVITLSFGDDAISSLTASFNSLNDAHKLTDDQILALNTLFDEQIKVNFNKLNNDNLLLKDANLKLTHDVDQLRDSNSILKDTVAKLEDTNIKLKQSLVQMKTDIYELQRCFIKMLNAEEGRKIVIKHSKN